MRIDPGAHRSRILIVLTFLPFLVKAVDCLLLGSYAPIVTFGLLAGLVAWGLRRGGAFERRAVRTWAVALILWAIGRLAILAMFAWTSVSEAAIEARLTPVYAAISVLFLAAGVGLFRNPVKART